MLKTIKNLQLLINLFQQREIVRKDDAIKICNISERSFYRYINTLSETNIPIFYDYEKKGYRLSEKTKSKKIEYSSQELCYLLAALTYFKDHVTKTYKENYLELIAKIESLTTFNVDDVFTELLDNIEAFQEESPMNFQLTKSLVFLATTQKFPILIIYNQEEFQKTITINNASIEFKNAWYLIDIENNLSIPLKTITFIRLLL